MVDLRRKAIEEFQRKKLCPPPTLVSSLRFSEALLAIRNDDYQRLDEIILRAIGEAQSFRMLANEPRNSLPFGN